MNGEVVYVQEFIAIFVENYFSSSLFRPQIESFQAYVRAVLWPNFREDCPHVCKMLQQFAGYLDDGFVKNAHHSLKLIAEHNLNKSAAIFFSPDISDVNIDYIGDSGIDY
ncbi:hypothetical protein Trichorick_00043 [Candidatus Trichorickettsia mobilis]|uniref:Uncharacterized protein n=1 Tax=Candidatus Trichorickettsia mobilis TaxID=1346319 RepID=A0ABZ0UT82_9RICK|nr:hypothetical protein Trichorick_00043 [Candidatus Trichorickettsia mobilis]